MNTYDSSIQEHVIGKHFTTFEFQYFHRKIVELIKVEIDYKQILKFTHANYNCKTKMSTLSINIQKDYHRKRFVRSQAAIPPIPNTPTKLTWEVSGCQFCFSPHYTVFFITDDAHTAFLSLMN